jgi:hypothetical protein
MKKLAPLFWITGALLFYVLSSGPSLRLKRTNAWPTLDRIYLPLSYLDLYTPAWRVLRPYWDCWLDPNDYNPLIFG